MCKKSMFIFEIAVFFVFGLYFGSFITAISMRIANEQKVFVKYSTCDYCSVRLKLWHMIPVFGLILCKGKCVKCKNNVGFTYAIWELLHGACYAINYYIYLQNNNLPAFVFLCFLTSIFVVISIIDFKTMYVYDIHIILMGVFLCAFLYYTNQINISVNSFILATIPLLFKLTYENIRKMITKQSVTVLGMADVKIFVIYFFFLDFLKISFILAMCGIFGMLFGFIGRVKNQSYFPFVPSISLSAYIVFIWNLL